MSTVKAVLFISYNFPPHGGSGVQRSLKFVKYLPRFGWRPLVVTTTGDSARVQDPTLLADIPADTFIRRLPGFSIVRLQRTAQKYHLEKFVITANLLLQLPDAMRFWAHSARRAVLEIVRRERPDVIYTTSGPYSAHLLGQWVRLQTGLPWLADFRDPWSRNLLVPYPPGYRWLNARIERRVLAAADRIACVSGPWLEDLRENLGRDPGKFFVLPNGYDDSEIKSLKRSQKNSRFTIVHYGTFHRNRRPDQFIAAVRELVHGDRIPLERLRVVFIGRNALKFVPKEPPFEPIDFLPHGRLEYYRQEADVLLLILATSRDNIGNHSGKIYEYIASNRPILAIVPPGGEAEKLIVETRTGLAVDGQVSAIAKGIEVLFHQWQKPDGIWCPNWKAIRKHTRYRATKKLADEFGVMLQEARD